MNPTWLRRNSTCYNLATYINHTIALFIGRDYDGVVIFVRRADTELVRLESKLGYVEPYFEVVKEYLLKMVLYLRENNLVSKQVLELLPEKYKNEGNRGRD
jgi:hypothetical protein